MITAWIDEKKLGDRLQNFRAEHLGAVQTFMGKSLRPFTWKHEEPRHVFGLDSFMCFLGAIEILVLTDIQKQMLPQNSFQFCGFHDERKPIILFGEQAKHVIQSFNFVHIEMLSFEMALPGPKKHTAVL